MPTMIEYRRKHGSDTWHWCTQCSSWPTAPGTYESKWSATRPSGDLDNECKSKEGYGKCTPNTK